MEAHTVVARWRSDRRCVGFACLLKNNLCPWGNLRTHIDLRMMNKLTMNNILGMVVYFLAASIFGAGVAIILLALHEDNDRCQYYNGEWNKEDLLHGLAAIAVGKVAHYVVGKYIVGQIFF